TGLERVAGQGSGLREEFGEEALRGGRHFLGPGTGKLSDGSPVVDGLRLLDMRQCLFTNQRHPELIQDLLSCLLREGVRVLCILRGLFPTWAVQTWQWILGGVEDVLLEAGLDRLPVNTPIEG